MHWLLRVAVLSPRTSPRQPPASAIPDLVTVQKQNMPMLLVETQSSRDLTLGEITEESVISIECHVLPVRLEKRLLVTPEDSQPAFLVPEVTSDEGRWELAPTILKAAAKLFSSSPSVKKSKPGIVSPAPSNLKPMKVSSGAKGS